LNATGRAPGGTLAADHMATDVAGRVAAFNPGTAANDQSGTNAGREFNDRATAPASARESRASGPSAVGELAARIDGAAAVRTDEVLAAGAIADRATAAHGVSLAIAGVTPAAAVTDAAAVSATDTSDSTIPDESDLRRQLVQAIKFQWRDGAGDVKLTLQPGYLGDVAISLRVEQNGGVTAHVQADASDVRSWISANEPLLRQGLTEQGLTLDRLVVAQEKEEATSDHEGRKRQPQQETPEQLPKRRETAIFEVIV
jgi:flagellar hook-length control protein FliK